MPTVKPIVAIVLDEDTAKRIEDFQYNYRFKNRSAAINVIIKAGMRALASKYPELDVSVKLETGKKSENDVVNHHAEIQI